MYRYSSVSVCEDPIRTKRFDRVFHTRLLNGIALGSRACGAEMANIPSGARDEFWPQAIAPFEVVLVPVNAHKSQRVRDKAEEIYQQLLAAGVDVLIDDRGLRPGVAFADWDLIGIPHRLILGERGLDNGVIEYKHRGSGDSAEFKLEDTLQAIQGRLEK